MTDGTDGDVGFDSDVDTDTDLDTDTDTDLDTQPDEGTDDLGVDDTGVAVVGGPSATALANEAGGLRCDSSASSLSLVWVVPFVWMVCRRRWVW